MRRLLPAIVTVGLLLGSAAPAFAGNRVPRGVTKISVALTFTLKLPTAQKPVYRTFARIRTVAEVIHATDALRPVRSRGVCPMIIVLRQLGIKPVLPDPLLERWQGLGAARQQLGAADGPADRHRNQLRQVVRQPIGARIS